ncbi:MAG: hypothetical protein ACOC8Y_05885 [Candidatus Natronoplasma sp.]
MREDYLKKKCDRCGRKAQSLYHVRPLGENLCHRCKRKYDLGPDPSPDEIENYDPTVTSKRELREEAEMDRTSKFECPVCEEQHEIIWQKRIVCRCNTEFYLITAGVDEHFEMGIMQNLQHDLDLKGQSAAVIRFDYSVAEKSVDLVLMLGKSDLKRAEPCGNSSHLRVPRSALKDEYFVLNLTG